MTKRAAIIFLFLTLFLSSIQAEEKSVNLIWQIPKERYFETDWLTEILENVEYNEIIDGNYNIVVNNALVIITLHDNHLYKDYFAKFDQNKFKYAIIHVGDELYGHRTDCYKNAEFVLRNYWHKKFTNQKHVYAFPVGYASGFWKDAIDKNVKPASERAYVWSFAGQITHKPTREAMITHMRTVPQHFVYETFAWADANSLSRPDYRNILLNSIFVPCPTGWWNIDSFRVSEALECGCIPIVENKPFDYFTRLFGRYPFLSVSTWDQAPELINKLLADPIRLEQVRRRCHQWWLHHKKTLKKEIATLCIKKLL